MFRIPHCSAMGCSESAVVLDLGPHERRWLRRGWAIQVGMVPEISTVVDEFWTARKCCFKRKVTALTFL